MLCQNCLFAYLDFIAEFLKIQTQILISMVCHFVAHDIYSLMRIFLVRQDCVDFIPQ